VVEQRRTAVEKLEHVASTFFWPSSVSCYAVKPSEMSTWQYAQKLAAFAGWLDHVKVRPFSAYKS
jgi:hypothetical protein